MNSDRAVVTSSHTTVAAVTATSVIPVRDERTGRILQELSAAFSLRSPGWTTVRVTLDGKSDTISVFVHLKGRSDALVVDTFTVIEYRASPYLVYAPLLKLREPTGTLTAEVISVQFTLGAMTTGMCYSSIIYGPGESAHLNGIYDYLWSNDLIFVSLGGQPLAGDVATARVIVRDAAGGYGEITATGSVQRMVVNPVLPAPRGPGWQCNN